jgi:hypothetical protein
MVYPLRKLLPAGTLVLRRGMPAILATRGLFFAAYTSTQRITPVTGQIKTGLRSLG